MRKKQICFVFLFPATKESVFMKKIKGFMAFLLILATFCTCFSFSISALSSGKTVNVSKKIAVDSMKFKGVTVKAYYKPRFSGYDSDMTSLGTTNGGYCCAGLVYQFYKRVYGVRVNNLYAVRNSTGTGDGLNFKKSAADGLYYNVPMASKGYFYRVTEPKTGDIVVSNNHWAIAKKVSGSKVTLLEQNYWWYPYKEAVIERQISSSSNQHWFFRYSGSASVVVEAVSKDSDRKDADKNTIQSSDFEVWTVCSDNGINIRKGAGTSYAIKTAVPDGTILHISDKKIAGGLLWGKCELGWCAIEYADYVGGSCGNDTYTLEFCRDGAKGSMSKMVVALKTQATAPKCTLKNGKKAFSGWNIFRESDRKWFYTNGKKNGWYKENSQPFGFSKYLLKSGEKFSRLSYVNNDNIELHPLWKGDKPTVADLGIQTASSAVYTGKTVQPTTSIFYGSKKLQKNKDFTVSFSGGKSIGPAVMTVRLKGSYTGSFTRHYKVLPQAISGLKITDVTRNGLKVSWKKLSSVKGYQIWRKNPKTGKYEKLPTVTKNTTVYYKDSKLKKNTSYTYRLRSYKKVNSTYYYSDYRYIECKTKK